MTLYAWLFQKFKTSSHYINIMDKQTITPTRTVTEWQDNNSKKKKSEKQNGIMWSLRTPRPICGSTSRPTYRSTYRPMLEWYVGRHIGQLSANVSIEMCRSTCQPTYRTMCWQLTDRPPILDRYSTVKKSAECRPLYQPTSLLSIGRHSGRHTGRHIGQHIDRCSTNTPRPTYRSRCWPTYRSSLDRYVERHLDQYVGRDVDRHISRGVRKLHMKKNNDI